MFIVERKLSILKGNPALVHFSRCKKILRMCASLCVCFRHFSDPRRLRIPLQLQLAVKGSRPSRPNTESQADNQLVSTQPNPANQLSDQEKKETPASRHETLQARGAGLRKHHERPTLCLASGTTTSIHPFFCLSLLCFALLCFMLCLFALPCFS